MRYDRDAYDRAAYDRAGANPYIQGIAGTGAFTVVVDRTIPLSIDATGAYSDELVNRTIPLSIDATGAFDLLVDYAKLLSWDATGVDAILLNRSLQLAFDGTGVFDYPDFRRIIDLAFSGTGSIETDPFLRLMVANWGATGGYLTLPSSQSFSSQMFFDRGRYDRASGFNTTGLTYPVQVNRTIPLSITGTGVFSTPLLDWYLQCGWAATGAVADPLVNRTIPLAFDGTGQFADITPFIPVHYLTTAWGGTGTFIFGYTWLFDIGWGATGADALLLDRSLELSLSGTGLFSTPNYMRGISTSFGATGAFTTPAFLRVLALSWGTEGSIVQTNPYIPIHYLVANWTATGAFIDPRVWRAIVNINNLLISGKISRSLADKMYSAVFQFDKTTTSDALYWSKVVFKMPDYTGTTFNTVFVGVVPSGDTQFTNVRQFATSTGKQQFKAYDYAWYLSTQYVEPENQTFLTWADQQNDLTYRLNTKNLVLNFTVGDRVVGASSGDSGTVTLVTAGYIYLKSMIGSAPYFQDSEHLQVAGTTYRDADGVAVDISGSITQVYPENYIMKLLGGDASGSQWAKISGINPIAFSSSGSVWGSTIPEIEFAFTPTTTKIQAIEKICEYMNWIFYVRWGGASDTPYAYFLPRANLDTTPGSPLPAPVYVTSSADYNSADARKYLKSPFKLVQSGENQYNFYTVRCQGLAGEWHQAVEYDGDPYDAIYNPSGTEIKRPYSENNPNITTYAECATRAAALKLYYASRVQTWTATFRLRSDFALLQKLIISGYGTSIPDGDYRITSIEYNYDKAGTVNEVTVQLILDSKFSAFLNLKRVFYDPIFEIQNIAQKIYNDNTTNLKGIVLTANSLPTSQEIKVALTGVYGSVMRTAYSTTALVAGDSVTLTQDQTSGRLMAVKA